MRAFPEGNVCVLPVVPLFETIEDLEQGPDMLRAFLAEPVTRRSLAFHAKRALPARRAAAAGDGRLQRQQQGRRHSRQPVGAAKSADAARESRARVRREHPLFPRPRRNGEPRRGPDAPLPGGAAARLAERAFAAHRAGRNDRAKVREPRHRDLQSRAAARRHHRHHRAPRAAGRGVSAARPGAGEARRREQARLPLAARSRGVHDVLPAGHADRRARAQPHRLAPLAPHRAGEPRRPARDPVGLQLEPGALLRARLVRRRQRPRRARAGGARHARRADAPLALPPLRDDERGKLARELRPDADDPLRRARPRDRACATSCSRRSSTSATSRSACWSNSAAARSPAAARAC